MSNCVVVQHLEPEGPYRISDALQRRDVEVDVCRVFAGDAVPDDLSGYDGVVVMGGPMSATSDDRFPSRRAEIALLADALERGVPALGVCLGAQLLAVAGGGTVYRGANGAEIGWAPVALSRDAADDPLFSGLPSSLTVLHWHGDTFDLPPGAVHLASSRHYRNQAFRCGSAAWGLQFHLEVDAGAVAAFTRAFGDEAERCGVPLGEIDGPAPGHLSALEGAGQLVLERFASLVCERAVKSGDRSCL